MYGIETFLKVTKHLSEQPGKLCCICLKVLILYSLFSRIPFPFWPLSTIFLSNTLLSRAKVGEPQPRAGEKNGARKVYAPFFQPASPQHGVSSQISINLGKRYLRISCSRKIAVTLILARVFAYLLSFFFQILDFIY